MRTQENKEPKFKFYHMGKWAEMTAKEISELPQKLKKFEGELKDMEYLNKAANEALTQVHQIALNKYYKALSQQIFALSTGFKIKYVAVLIEKPHAPNFFVLAEIIFGAEGKIHSLSLTQKDIRNSRQIVNQERNNLFQYKNKTSVKGGKDMKQKFDRVATIVKANFVERSQPNYDKCNAILRGWVAQIF